MERKERFLPIEKGNFFVADQFSRGTLLRLVVPLKRGITMPVADRGEKFQRDARGDGEDAFVGKKRRLDYFREPRISIYRVHSLLFLSLYIYIIYIRVCIYVSLLFTLGSILNACVGLCKPILNLKKKKKKKKKAMDFGTEG